MTLYIDRKYISLLSPKLERFTQKSENLWNFRCPYCGDSQKNKLKSRGYIYRKKSNLFYMCHNCGVSISVGNFIKYMDGNLYKEYVLEKFKNDNGDNTPKPDFNALKTTSMLREKFSSTKLDIPSINELNDEHIAKKYLIKRQIPKEYFTKIHYAENFKTFIDRLIPEHGKNLYEEPRLVFPFRDEKNILLGVQGRALGKSAVRYITIRTHEEAKKVYGLDRVDISRRVYIVEGPIDSMFLENSLAMMDAALYRANQMIDADDMVYVYDNEPRNKQIVQNMERTISMGHRICIWPKNVVEKDINDMILAGYTGSQVQSIIDTSTFEDLRARMEFDLWRKM